MNEAEEILSLVGEIYDASLNPATWPAVFEKATKYIGGSATHLFLQDMVGGNSTGYFDAGHDPHFLELYHQKYSKINPIFPTVVFQDIEKTLSIPDCLPFDEFCQSQFVREWVMPQGYVGIVFSNIEKSATSCAVLSVLRHFKDNITDDEMRYRFGLVVPHIRRATLIGKVIDLHKVEAAALADSLDTMASGMFIVNAAGHIVHGNASGYAMLAEARVLRALGGQLRAHEPAADQALLDSFTASEGGDAALGRKGVAVPLKARDGERYVAHVMPLTSGARRRTGIYYGAVATVFVRKAELDLPSPPVAIAEEFRLTPAELRVLFYIVQMGGVSEVAEVLGISEATVKTHLHHVFKKTGTAGQSDLVKLVAGYCVAP